MRKIIITNNPIKNIIRKYLTKWKNNLLKINIEDKKNPNNQKENENQQSITISKYSKSFKSQKSSF